MPELPEVEISCRGIRPHLVDQKISAVIVRNFKLRWPIPDDIATTLQGQTISLIKRRAKYLLLYCEQGILIIHLGMSGHLQIIDDNAPAQKHDHVDVQFENGLILRYTDPRRFGAILWWPQYDLTDHPLFNHLGPEPLSDEFSTDYFNKILPGRRTTIKTFIMNGKHVVGVGNIYANEALFLAGIHPKTTACNVSSDDIKNLVSQIKYVLKKAIKAGGTTLKDFKNSEGKPGYFAQQLNVYGRAGQQCTQCDSVIGHYKESQRATFFCLQCQPLQN